MSAIMVRSGPEAAIAPSRGTAPHMGASSQLQTWTIRGRRTLATADEIRSWRQSSLRCLDFVRTQSMPELQAAPSIFQCVQTDRLRRAQNSAASAGARCRKAPAAYGG